MIVSECNPITGQKLFFIDVEKIELSILKELIEFETDPMPEYFTNKNCFENEGAYAEDSNED